MNIFLALPKATTDEKAESYKQVVKNMTQGKATITTSKEDFTSNFAQSGSWDSWIGDVAEGIDFVTRKPKYQAIICVERIVGRATAQIVERSLSAKKIVTLLEDGMVRQITNVKTVDENNWISGWELCEST